MTKICVPVFGNNLQEARERAERAISSGADLVEIRADLIPGSDVRSIADSFSELHERSIFTLRSAAEGGRSILSPEERRDWIQTALALPFAYVDLELDADAEILSTLGEQREHLIVSKHFFDTWEKREVLDTLAKCCSLGGIGKVAAKVNDVMESLRLLEILDEIEYDNFALMAMGPGGEITRAFASSIGSKIAYCALDDDSKVAQGQLDLRSQRRISRDERKIVGLMGHPLGHTLSPIMHNAAFESSDIPGIYLPFDIPESAQVAPFLRRCADLGIRGLNVTIPYKEVAFSTADLIEDEARRAGAINVIIIDEKGSLIGHNTDIYGFEESIRRSGYRPRDNRALIVGAGGAARAAIIALNKMGAKITIANRTTERTNELVKGIDVSIETLSLEQLELAEPFSIIVNATPVGMSGFEDSQIIPEKLISEADTIMDMVYNPSETSLIKIAKRYRVRTITGLDMLLFQGAKAFELWCGIQPPIDVMRRRLLEAIGE